MLITAHESDGAAVLRIGRPEARNALNLELAAELADAVDRAASSAVGAIALLADGDHFCVGGDVRAMASADDVGRFVRELADQFHRAVRAITAGVPVVTGVRGWAAGAGFSLALATDIVIAGESASFQPAYPGIGATPDGGLTWTLPRAVGERRARSILLRNAVIPAPEALTLGIVDRVVADADVDSAVLEVAAGLARGPRAALAATKRLVAAGASASLPPHLDAEAASIGERIASPEGREGVAAFLERRSPVFIG
jgi:2-(1,2-epoxy-1,2-dihydrophenyl)acetyl-CoA isomerase